jgi:hypothetical protein
VSPSPTTALRVWRDSDAIRERYFAGGERLLPAKYKVPRPAFGVTSKNLKGVSKSCVGLWRYLA